MREPIPYVCHASETDAAWRRSFRRRLVAWYVKQGRELPWRATRDPYRVWISEIMLQQTTVAAVVPYYERFLARFPTVGTLAKAEEHDVLRLWEGLGYYSRARNLHRTAERIVAEQGGAFPQTAATLAGLPGIGRYTAGAIASFAFDQPAAIVEANTLRLYCRLLAYRGDPRSSAGQQRLWSFAEQIMPRTQAGRFNHALMDLGATICTPQSPRCDVCPVRQNCAAFRLGLQDEVPRPNVRVKPTAVTEAYIAVRKHDAYLLRRRPAGERWAGLWDFPRCELSADEATETPLPPEGNGQKALPLVDGVPDAIRIRIEEQVARQTGFRIALGMPFAELRHAVTRFRIRVLCFDARRRAGRANDSHSVQWAQPAQFADLAFSRPGRRLAELLARRS